MDYQQWEVQAWDKRTTRPKTGENKEAAINKARRDGASIATEKKYGAGGNRSVHAATVNAKKIEDSDEMKVERVDQSLSRSIQQARAAKNMTQKQLATAINEKPQVIGEYESGRAIPNPQIIVKIERALGCRLPRARKK